jgi:hypothetical protein
MMPFLCYAVAMVCCCISIWFIHELTYTGRSARKTYRVVAKHIECGHTLAWPDAVDADTVFVRFWRKSENTISILRVDVANNVAKEYTITAKGRVFRKLVCPKDTEVSAMDQEWEKGASTKERYDYLHSALAHRYTLTGEPDGDTLMLAC